RDKRTSEVHFVKGRPHMFTLSHPVILPKSVFNKDKAKAQLSKVGKSLGMKRPQLTDYKELATEKSGFGKLYPKNSVCRYVVTDQATGLVAEVVVLKSTGHLLMFYALPGR